jgi:hypothetical protein
MTLKTHRLAIAMILTAMTIVAGGVTAAGTASASVAAPQASTSCSTDSIMNVQSELYLTGGVKSGAYYVLENGFQAYDFCPEYEATNDGTTYYYYQDSSGLCMTANLKAGDVDEETCGLHPASQEWHYYFDSTAKDGTLENSYTGECLWAEGQPPKADSLITEGGCTRNQNNTMQEVPNG